MCFQQQCEELCFLSGDTCPQATNPSKQLSGACLQMHSVVGSLLILMFGLEKCAKEPE